MVRLVPIKVERNELRFGFYNAHYRHVPGSRQNGQGHISPLPQDRATLYLAPRQHGVERLDLVAVHTQRVDLQALQVVRQGLRHLCDAHNSVG